MKILKIHFKNINSLEGEHEIDFTKKPFSTNNLFAITGPTGSGKSTILDVIPLALYNRIPRMETSVSKKMMDENGAILTRGQKDAYASVTYACKQGIYKSEWSVRVARTGNLQDYEMFLYNEDGLPITQKKSEVPAKNESLIGLNYDQFIKSMMLAQGEFSRFLKVKKAERSKLLEQITGADIYRRLGIAAYEKFKGFKNSVDEWEKKIEDLKLHLLSEDDLKEIKTLEEQLNQKEDLFKKKLSSIDRNIELLDLFKEKKNIVTKFSKEAESLQTKLKNFKEAAGEKLVWHERTEDFGDELLKWNTLRQEQRHLEKEHAAKFNEKEVAKNKIKTLKTEIEKWIQNPDIPDESIEHELNEFYNKINLYTEQRKEKISKYNELKSAIDGELKVLDLSFNNLNVQDLIQRLNEKQKFLKPLKISELSKTDYNDKKNKLQQEIDEIYLAEKTATSVLNFQENFNQKSEQLKKFKADNKNLIPDIELLEAKVKDEEKDLEILQLQLEKRNLEKSLIDYRRGLEENQPCPVCGSTHHPWAEKPLEETDELKENLLLAQDKLERNKNEKVRLEEKSFNLKNNINLAEKELENIQKELLPLTKNFQTSFLNFSVNDNFTELTQLKKNELSDLEKIFTALEQKSALEKAIPLLKEINLVTEQGIKLKNEIERATGGKDLYATTQDFLKRWNHANAQLINSIKNYKEVSEEKSEKEKNFKGLENNLLRKVTANGFTTILSAFSHRLTNEEAKNLKTKKSNLEQEFRKISTEKDVHEKELKKLNEKVEGLDISELENTKNNILEETEKIQREQKELFAQLKQQEFNHQKIKDLEKKINEENKESHIWRILNQLIGDAQGKNFNDFAQDLTLNHLLHLANKRLNQLSSRYWLSQPHKDEDDGLVAIDQDMGNQRRSVKTLSGGETFILSLALALALSDLASKNVRIETLFIDEGFGTLDPETLDKTLDTLERLQEENQKMIGVISHVEMLKERISSQVQLKQNGNGLSSMQVVG